MAIYMGMRIMEEALDYEYVVTRRPDLKAGIDDYLMSKGRDDLINGSA
ncbi:hypothetical protein [Paenibacillus spongiae]|uniref:Uncharacterized protein n=1 Tax=Paenibacillus spongiae TaxID=2909671 RepID=A0ABY5SEM9_9BACL|nr:hypothetical protein [Paenibacillus spongiae]UVI32099.1 hypothetical protein L1F29_09880 [Paenibacillus spongiae]